NSTAASAVAAFAVCFCRRVVILPLGFLRMAQRSTRTVERFRLRQGNVGNRIDKLKEFTIGRFFVEVVGLVANGVTLAAFHPMIVIIQNLLERPAINHSLIALEACALFSFKCLDGDRAEFDSLHRAPWIDVALENLNAVKTRILECRQKTFLSQRAGNASAPQLRILLHFFGYGFITYYIGDHGASAFLEHPENFV